MCVGGGVVIFYQWRERNWLNLIQNTKRNAGKIGKKIIFRHKDQIYIVKMKVE